MIMKEVVVNSIISNIKKYYNYSDVKLAEIKYGIESLYLSIFKTLVIFIISFIFHFTKELILLFIFYGLLRLTAFGVHAKKSWQCWFSSILTFTILPLLIKYVVVNNLLIDILSVIFLVILAIYAPADTEKRPIYSKKKRNVYKLLTIIISTIYVLLIIFSNNIYMKNILFYSLLNQVILILPITYKLFGVQYSNYKRKGGKI